MCVCDVDDDKQCVVLKNIRILFYILKCIELYRLYKLQRNSKLQFTLSVGNY